MRPLALVGSTRQPLEQACPMLGLRDDEHSHALYARTDHVCALPWVRPPSETWQRAYCLGSNHSRCPYLHAPGPTPPPGPQPLWWQSTARYWLPACIALVALDILAIVLILTLALDWSDNAGAAATLAPALLRLAGLPF